MRIRFLFLTAVTLALVTALSPCWAARRAHRPVRSPLAVVDSVQGNSPAALAGLAPGDIVVRLNGQRKPTLEEVLAYRFDLENARAASLNIKRGGESLRVELSQGDWGCELRPDLSAETLQRLAIARKGPLSGEGAAATQEQWASLAGELQRAGFADAAAWVRLERGKALTAAKLWDAAAEAFETLEKMAPPGGFWTFAAVLKGGQVLERSGRGEEAALAFAQACDVARQCKVPLRLASALAARRIFEWHRDGYAEALKFGEEALAIRERFAPESLAVVESLSGLGDVALARSEFDAAQAYVERAVAICQRIAPGTLPEATALMSLGAIALARGDLSAAKELYLKALVIREKVTPGSVGVAWSLNSLGIVADEQGDPKGARGFYTRALETVKKLDPGGMNMAACLNNLGAAAWAEGDLHGARKYFEASLAIRERKVPGGSDVSVSLNNLGAVAWAIGDLATARKYYVRSLAIRERLVPNSLALAAAISNLGAVAHSAGDFVAAKESLLRSLAICEGLAPDSMYVAMDQCSLGEIARAEGDFAAARAYQERALELKERIAPDSVEVALSFHNLAILATDEGRIPAAREYHKRALAIRERVAQGSLDVASSLSALGELARGEGNLAEARSLHGRALEIRQRLAPESLSNAQSLNSMASVARASGDLPGCISLLKRAVDTLEAQRGMVGGESSKATFSATTGVFYTDLLAAYLDQGEPEAALETLERSRARALLEVIASRSLDLEGEIPAALLERQRELAQRRATLYLNLSGSDARPGGEEADAWHMELLLLPQKEDALAEEIRKASPRLAALEYPKPLPYPGIVDALKPGTLLLAFAVAERETFLFALLKGRTGEDATGDTLRVIRLPIEKKKMEMRVGAFRQALGPEAVAGEDSGTWRKVAQRLYADLLAPASREIARSQRILVIPDGPLHALPFAALLPSGKRLPKGLASKPLGLQRPITIEPSMTVYVELEEKEKDPANRKVSWTGFGDPVYSRGEEEANPNSETAALKTRGFVLDPILGTRREVEAISALFAEEGKTLLGSEATEEAVGPLTAETTFLHFACHGLITPEFPLNSALALTATSPSIPGTPTAIGDNRRDGLLQAWEIIQDVKLDADCVVLSACQTGRGKVLGGEGIMGLTRAFFFAGSRSVVVSLWSISDASTAIFMETFYREILAGAPRELALQRAQIALEKDKRYSHPFYWAAFELHGRGD